MFLPMFQQMTGLFHSEKLRGVFDKTEKPEFSLESYKSGEYQKQLEAYTGENFGFRETVIRLYNQYLWDFYRKTYVKEVVRGKNDWLFYPQNVNDYYGTEIYKWMDSTANASQVFSRELDEMCRLREALKPFGIDFLVFMAPEKGALYSEYLPEREYDTTTINAREFFAAGFDEKHFPCIEMTRWFQQMKDTATCPLIPQTGAHWNFSCVYAADSLFRLMEQLKGIELADLKTGSFRPVPRNSESDRDLEYLLNLQRRIRLSNGLAPEADVEILADSATVKPKVLFIGNSYLWRINHYVPLNQVFGEVEFWYYNTTAYYGSDLKESREVKEYDLLEKLFDFDFIVWFTTGNQMYKPKLFVENAMDVLYLGDTVLNPDLPYVRIAKEIRKDTVWMAALEKQALLHYRTPRKMLYVEARNVANGDDLLKDQLVELDMPEFLDVLMERTDSIIRSNPQWFQAVEKQAVERNVGIDEMLKVNARWTVRNWYGLLDIGENDRIASEALLGEFFKWKIDVTEAAMRSDSVKMKKISETSAKSGRNVEQVLHDEAVREICDKYGLPETKMKL